MTDKEIMQQALDALETKGEHHPRVYEAIKALRSRPEQPEDEPVSLKPCRSPYCECDSGKCTHPGFYDARDKPQPAAWVGLTDDEILSAWSERDGRGVLESLRDVEAKLKERNT
jgi:hypothetical protein